MKIKRLFGVALVLLVFVGILCLTAVSASADGVSWDLSDGVLTISGTGSMDPLCYSGTSPWYYQRLKVKSIVIEEGITSIGYRAFMSCANATSVSIPSTVTSIKEGAFEYCGDITELKLPAGLKSIGDFAFTSCSDVTELTLPDGLESIGKGAFSSMGITELVIPESVTFIDDYALRYCTKLESVTLPSHMTELPDQLLAYCDALTTVELPEGLTSLGTECFYRSTGLTHITIPAGITAVDEYTFYYCSNLEEITFEGTVTSVGKGAFEGAAALTSFPFTDAITEIGYRAFAESGLSGELVLPAGLTAVSEAAFSECVGITSISFPESVEKIDFQAFYGCTGIESLTIPETIKVIGEGAFQNCCGIKSLTLHDSIESIGDNAFYCCCGIENELIIPAGIGYIGYQAFGDCDKLTAVTLEGVDTVYGGAPFGYCDLLKEIFLPEGITELPTELFSNLTSLKTIVLPDTLTSLGDSAFFCNEALTSVTIPENISVIPSQCFYGCVNLEKVNVEGEIVRIEDSAFCDTRSLTDFDFAPGLTYIGDFAFTRSGLNGDVVIPEGVTYVGDYAFWASAIESITLPSTMEYVSNYTFWETNLKYINVHEDNQHYASVDGVLYTEDMKELIMYNNRSSRVEFHIPATVEKVHEYCFYGGAYDDVKLERIIFPRSINELPGYVFYNFSVDRVYVYKNSYAEEYFGDSWDIDIVYVVDKIELLTPPSRLVYPIGGKFSTAGMTVSFEDSEGYTGVIDSGFDIGEYDFSTPGLHTVSVGYNGKWISFSVTVDPDLVLLPYSDHPYENEFYGEWEYTDKYNYESLDVTFAEETRTEDYYDTITVYDKDGNEVGVYSGLELSGTTINVPGNYFRIVLESDYSANEWGFEVVEVKGNCEHTMGEWSVTKEPTTESVGEETLYCSKCGEPLETREIPMLEPEILPTINGVFNYTVSMVNLTDIKEIRFAVGHYTTGAEIREAQKSITLDASTVAEHIDDYGTFKYDLPWAGEYTAWVRKTDGSSVFLHTNVNYINPYLEADGVRITVKDFGDNYKDLWIAKGHFTTYSEIKASNEFKFQASGSKLANYFATHDYSYTVTDPGEYTVLIRYNDGSFDVLYTTLTVDEPVFTPNGLQLTVSNIPDLKIIRTAPGKHNSVAELKAAEGVRNFSNKTVVKDADPYTIQYREEGWVTVIVEYENGYKHVYHHYVEPKVPTVEQNGSTVTFSDLDGLVTLRYAKGEYTTSSQIKKAEGSKALKPANIVDGKISVTLDVGIYTFCVQYDDESYNYYTVTVE